MNLHDCLNIAQKPIKILNSSLIKYNTWSQKNSSNHSYFICHVILSVMPILEIGALILSATSGEYKDKPKEAITNFMSFTGAWAWGWLIADILSITKSNRQHITPSEEYQNWQKKLFPIITSSIIFFSTLVALLNSIDKQQKELMKADDTNDLVDTIILLTGEVSVMPIFIYLLAKIINQPKFRREINLPQLQNNLIDNNNNPEPINNAPAITIINSNNLDEDSNDKNCAICLGPLNERSDLNDSPRSEEKEGELEEEVKIEIEMEIEMEDENESKSENESENENKNERDNENERGSENNTVISDGDIHINLTINSDDAPQGHQITELECKHKFHLPCLEMWSQKNDDNASCPECRAPFSMQ